MKKIILLLLSLGILHHTVIFNSDSDTETEDSSMYENTSSEEASTEEDDDSELSDEVDPYTARMRKLKKRGGNSRAERAARRQPVDTDLEMALKQSQLEAKKSAKLKAQPRPKKQKARPTLVQSVMQASTFARAKNIPEFKALLQANPRIVISRNREGTPLFCTRNIIPYVDLRKVVLETLTDNPELQAEALKQIQERIQNITDHSSGTQRVAQRFQQTMREAFGQAPAPAEAASASVGMISETLELKNRALRTAIQKADIAGIQQAKRDGANPLDCVDNALCRKNKTVLLELCKDFNPDQIAFVVERIQAKKAALKQKTTTPTRKKYIGFYNQALATLTGKDRYQRELRQAIHTGAEAEVQKWLDQGADPFCELKGVTPLRIALKSGREQIAQIVEAKARSLDAEQTDSIIESIHLSTSAQKSSHTLQQRLKLIKKLQQTHKQLEIEEEVEATTARAQATTVTAKPRRRKKAARQKARATRPAVVFAQPMLTKDFEAEQRRQRKKAQPQPPRHQARSRKAKAGPNQRHLRRAIHNDDLETAEELLLQGVSLFEIYRSVTALEVALKARKRDIAAMMLTHLDDAEKQQAIAVFDKIIGEIDALVAPSANRLQLKRHVEKLRQNLVKPQAAAAHATTSADRLNVEKIKQHIRKKELTALQRMIDEDPTIILRTNRNDIPVFCELKAIEAPQIRDIMFQALLKQKAAHAEALALIEKQIDQIKNAQNKSIVRSTRAFKDRMVKHFFPERYSEPVAKQQEAFDIELRRALRARNAIAIQAAKQKGANPLAEDSIKVAVDTKNTRTVEALFSELDEEEMKSAINIMERLQTQYKTLEQTESRRKRIAFIKRKIEQFTKVLLEKDAEPESARITASTAAAQSANRTTKAQVSATRKSTTKESTKRKKKTKKKKKHTRKSKARVATTATATKKLSTADTVKRKKKLVQKSKAQPQPKAQARKRKRKTLQERREERELQEAIKRSLQKETKPAAAAASSSTEAQSDSQNEDSTAKKRSRPLTHEEKVAIHQAKIADSDARMKIILAEYDRKNQERLKQKRQELILSATGAYKSDEDDDFDNLDDDDDFEDMSLDDFDDLSLDGTEDVINL